MAVEKTKYPNEFWLGLLPSAQGECSPQFSLAAFLISHGNLPWHCLAGAVPWHHEQPGSAVSL